MSQIDRRGHEQVDDYDQIVARQEKEAERAPQQQRGLGAAIVAVEQLGARCAGREAEEVDNGGYDFGHAQSFLILKRGQPRPLGVGERSG